MSGLGGGVGASGLGPDCKDGAKAATVVWILVLNYEYFYPLKQIVQNPLLLERHLLGIPRTTRTLKPRGKWWSSRFTVLQLNSSSMQDPIPYTHIRHPWQNSSEIIKNVFKKRISILYGTNLPLLFHSVI